MENFATHPRVDGGWRLYQRAIESRIVPFWREKNQYWNSARRKLIVHATLKSWEWPGDEAMTILLLSLCSVGRRYGGPEGHSLVDGRTFQSLTIEQHSHSNDRRSTMGQRAALALERSTVDDEPLTSKHTRNDPESMVSHTWIYPIRED